MNLPRANCAFDKTANRDQLAGNLAGHAGFFTNGDSVRAQITFQNAFNLNIAGRHNLPADVQILT